jgi:hypothetical protein
MFLFWSRKARKNSCVNEKVHRASNLFIILSGSIQAKQAPASAQSAF